VQRVPVEVASLDEYVAAATEFEHSFDVVDDAAVRGGSGSQHRGVIR
jgi:hypothetical protein